MESLVLEVYSHATNQAIVKMPGRRFPGLVIQRDTMSSLATLAESIYALAKKNADTELIEEACELKDWLNGYLLHYENVLAEHNIELPYARRGSGT